MKISKKKPKHWLVTVGLFCSWLFLSSAVYSQKSYSPYADQIYPMNVYWGDTHVHTKLSADVTGDNMVLGLDEAYRFAKGETMMTPNGMEKKLRRPLDFLVVADHATNLGINVGLEAADPLLLSTSSGKGFYEQWRAWQANPNAEKFERFFADLLFPVWGSGKKAVEEDHFFRSVWQQVTASADRHNDPGKFTAFIGYEWTSMGSMTSSMRDMNSTDRTKLQGNLHRVVLFKDSADKANRILPFSAFDSPDPEDLWQFLKQYEDTTEGEVIAIPHGANVSKGEMFSLTDFNGGPLTTGYAKTRSRWEPLYEVSQMKGDSETHPILSPTDEFADYETWSSWRGKATEDMKEPGWLEHKKSEYARAALKNGLDQQVKLGVNPFKFGLIGSTDSHTGMSIAGYDDFWLWAIGIPFELKSDELPRYGAFSVAGYAAVWAEENTRESLFSAMKRKEVYASTGPRMTVRFFGGWDYEPGDAFESNLAKIGYEKGVPMGGDLSYAPDGKSPCFLIQASKDPDGANLDRVQVIKGWHDDSGELHEKIYNVALSDNRKPNWRGKVKPVGSTVDILNASYSNSIGNPEFAVVWKDPDFNKDELAFYYVRVLEIPTPRWTAYGVKFFDLNDVPKEVPMVTQERAYTSPIWYSPEKS